MDKQTVEKYDRINELVRLLNHYRDVYYNEAKSEISDYEYDNLYDELVKLEEETGHVLNNSPTQSVGYVVKSSLQKIKHNHEMLSLDKTKDVNEVCKFLDAVENSRYILRNISEVTTSVR